LYTSWHAVGHQRDLERGLGRVAKAALAGEFLGIPQLGIAFRAIGDALLVVEQGHPPSHRAGAAGHRAAAHELVAVDHVPVQLFERAVLAAAHQFRRFHHHHIPGNVARLHHRDDLGHLAVVDVVFHRGAAGAGVALEQVLARVVLEPAAEAHHHQVARIGRGSRGQAGGDQGGTEQAACEHAANSHQGKIGHI